ncbi:MAG: hypothetical protein MI723_15775, partial [Caulobacterales bacterium]|nr:hypothetical protein [Caulobacterales bacterium]
MAITRVRGGRQDNADHWPGFVDALATLLLVVIFLLSLFAVAQYALGQALSGRDAEVARLNAQLTRLAEQLALEEARAEEFENESFRLRVSLEQAEAEATGLRGELTEAQARVMGLEADLASSTEEAEAAGAQVSLMELQIAALNEQLASLREALEASEARDVEQQAQIENLSQRLNAALAQKVQQLARFRSQFFEELAEALGDRADVRVVGDRFVFETDVLFDSASAELSEGGVDELSKIADVITDVAADIPDDID